MSTYFIITGNGKGKTTSGLGMLTRSIGQGGKCAIIQFIKDNKIRTGEYNFFTKLNVLFKNFGEGFTWKQEKIEDTKKKCIEGWNYFKKISKENYDFILLDEFTYLLNYNLLDLKEVINYLKDLRLANPNLNIIITGREAPKKLIEIFDCVSEIKEIKHHFKSKNQKALKGIEF